MLLMIVTLCCGVALLFLGWDKAASVSSEGYHDLGVALLTGGIVGLGVFLAETSRDSQFVEFQIRVQEGMQAQSDELQQRLLEDSERSEATRQAHSERLENLRFVREISISSIGILKPLSDLDLSETQLDGLALGMSNLQRSNLNQANLRFVDLSSSDLTLVNAEGADFTDSSFRASTLDDAYFKDSILRSVDLTGASLVRTDLTNAVLVEVVLVGADLRFANLSGADLSESDLTGARLARATFSYDSDLSRTVLDCTDAAGADLRGADLRNASLIDSNLTDADLSGANLAGADLSASDLRRANLTGADMTGTKLFGTKLSGADLSGTILDRFGPNDSVLPGPLVAEGDETMLSLGPTEVRCSRPS